MRTELSCVQIGGYDITKNAADELGGVLTVIATGSSNVSFAAAEGLGPAAGGPGQSLSLITSGSGSLTVTYDLVYSAIRPKSVQRLNQT